jgi:hypothetical protein
MITGADFLPSDHENLARKSSRRKVPGIKYGVPGIAVPGIAELREDATLVSEKYPRAV